MLRVFTFALLACLVAGNSPPDYHMLFVSFFTTGDFTPIYTVAREAMRLGNRVSVMTDATAEKHYNFTGMNFLPLKEENPQTMDQTLASMRELGSSNPRTFASDQMKQLLLNSYRGQHAGLLAYLAGPDARPDVIVTHGLTVAPLDVADKLGIPSVSIWPQSAPMYHTPLLSPTYACGGYPLHLSFEEKLRVAWCQLSQFPSVIPVFIELEGMRRALGYTKAYNEMGNTHRTIVSTVPGLGRVYPIPPLLHYVGPLLEVGSSAGPDLVASTKQPAENSVQAWLEVHSDVVFAAFGSSGAPSLAFLCSLVGALAQVAGEQGRHVGLLLASPHLASLMPLDQLRTHLVTKCAAGDASAIDLRLEAWVAQKAVLASPSVKLFCSHCGFGSLSEGLYNGKPILGMPFIFDQFDNAQMAVNMGAGEQIRPQHATRLDVIAALRALLGNSTHYAAVAERYARAARRLGGATRAVDYIIEEIEVGSKHLQLDPNSFLDVYALLAVAVAIAISMVTCVVWRVLRAVYWCACGNTGSRLLLKTD